MRGLWAMTIVIYVSNISSSLMSEEGCGCKKGRGVSGEAVGLQEGL